MPIVIFGVGTLGKLAYYYLTKDMKLDVTAFVIDRKDMDTKEKLNLFGLPIYFWDDFIKIFSINEVKVFVAVAYKSMRNRLRVFEKVRQHKYNFINIISSSAFVAKDSLVGNNNFIMPGVVLEPGTSLGSNNLIWSNSTICHDSKIGNHNFLGANFTMGGYSKIGDLSFFGFSSTISDKVIVGDEVLLAANSFLNSNTDKLTRMQGIPATKFSEIDSEKGINFF
tara:strand:- start:52 stop:723 length:672 start_codon:yes stop_codon:yes gene_type:complete